MTTRPATPSDAAQLAALHAAVFPAGPWGEGFWQDALSSRHDRVFVAGEPPHAFAALRLLGPEAEILTIGTTRRRRGDGSSLLAAMIAEAAAQGAERLFLEVSTANKAALAFYRGANFRDVGKRAGYYSDGSDAVVMRRDLAPQGS